MTRLDSVLADLAVRIRGMSIRGQAALFWACSEALVDAFLEWADRTGSDTAQVLRSGQLATYGFVTLGVESTDAIELLSEFEEKAPFGESIDMIPSTTAQDCWICADVGIRVWVSESYDPGPAIEFALEPILGTVTEELFGFTQVGSGPSEEMQIEAVLQDERIVRVLDFMNWATNRLGVEPDDEALAELRERGRVLLP